MQHLRNLPTLNPQALATMIEIHPGRVVSMALSCNDHCQMTLLAFAAGESVSEEQYFGDTLYIVVEGDMPLMLDGHSTVLHAGECMMVPSGILHAVGGDTAFKLLQIIVQ